MAALPGRAAGVYVPARMRAIDGSLVRGPGRSIRADGGIDRPFVVTDLDRVRWMILLMKDRYAYATALRSRKLRSIPLMTMW